VNRGEMLNIIGGAKSMPPAIRAFVFLALSKASNSQVATLSNAIDGLAAGKSFAEVLDGLELDDAAKKQALAFLNANPGLLKILQQNVKLKAAV
jgi:hypothetical protein